MRHHESVKKSKADQAKLRSPKRIEKARQAELKLN